MPFKFPYTNFQELNLDWIIKKVKDLSKQIEDDSSIVSEYIDRLLAVEDKADNAEATATAADARATGANTTANSALTMATQAKQTAEIADLSTTLLGLKIGDLSSLYTTAKDTIVNAINEVWSIFHNATAVTNVTPAGTDPAVTYSNGVFTFDLPEGGDPDAVTHAELDAALDELSEEISEELDNKADVIIDTASGDIASFPDGTATPLLSLVVNVEPVQNLNGQAAPYPPGWGKNLLDVNSINPRSSNGINVTVSNGEITLNGTATANAYFTIADTGYESDTYTLSFNNPVASSSVHIAFRNTDGVYWSDNQSNTVNKIATITGEPDDILIYVAGGTTVTNFTIKPQLEKGSSASSWSPYSNICPISGWTGVEVYDTGHNAWDEVWENGYIDASGNNAPSSAIIRSKNYIPVKGGQSYCFHITDTASMWMSITQYDADKNFISQVSVLTNYVLQLDANTKFVRFYASSGYGNTYNNDISINYPSTDTEYHAYKGNSYSVTFGETVYGGYDEIVSGNGKANFGRYKFTGNERTIQASANVVAINTPIAWKSSVLGLCTDFEFNSTGATNWIYLNTTMPAEDVQTYMGLHDVYAVCELATPTDLTTTPVPLTALNGYNNVWSDAGSVDVTYRADTKGYIDKLIAQVQALALGG